MTDMQYQIRPTHHDLKASAKAQYDTIGDQSP